MRAVVDLPLLAALLVCVPCAAQATDSISQLSRAGRIAEAAELARGIAENAPQDAGANLRAGGMLLRLSRYDQALPFLQRVTSIPNAEPWQQAWARVQLGRVQLALGDTVAARGALVEVLQLGAGRSTESEAAAILSRVGGHPGLARWTQIHTVHLRIHFPPDTRISDPRGFGSSLESAYARLSRFFGDLSETPDIYVWNTSIEGEPVMYRPLAFTRPEYMVVHMRFGQSPGHELAHLFSYNAAHPTLRTRFVDEGTSVAFNLAGTNLMREARTAVRLGGLPVDLQQFWDDRAGVTEPILYPVAGAFIQRLIREGGREKFMQLLEHQTYEDARRIYGDQFDTIAEAFLRELLRP